MASADAAETDPAGPAGPVQAGNCSGATRSAGSAVADRLGRRTVYVAGLVLFAASSLTCGLAPNVAVLLAARGVQGLGAAAMFATTMALISNTYEGRERGIAFGVWSGSARA